MEQSRSLQEETEAQELEVEPGSAENSSAENPASAWGDRAIEDADPVPALEAQGEGASQSVDEQIAALREEVERWKDTALRRQADLENYRKRVAREQSEAVRYANEGLLGELLPVLDHFELGLNAARQATDPAGVVMGMEMIARQLEQFLEGQRVAQVEAAPGDPFDPTRHEAVGQEADAGTQEGRILRSARKGYRLGERLLRPAAVVVSTGAGERSAGPGERSR